MARKRANVVPPLVLTVLRCIDEASTGKPLPHWVDVGSLNLDEDEVRIVASLVLAERLGLLQTGNDPAHSVAITLEGRKRISTR